MSSSWGSVHPSPQLASLRLSSTNGQFKVDVPDPEVIPPVRRRRFTGTYRQGILEETEPCAQPGELGALLCREVLYSSHLTRWRALSTRNVIQGHSLATRQGLKDQIGHKDLQPP